MQVIENSELSKAGRFFGRTIVDEARQATFFNWTGSGFEIRFEGGRLEADFIALDTYFKPEGTHWPWISVFLDDGDEPIRDICIDQPELRVTLLEESGHKIHKLKIVKRSENDKGKVGLRSVSCLGSLLPPQEQKSKLRIEFIGDSITCGFGNEAKHRDDPCLTGQENGLAAYGAVAAKLLDADYQSMSVSGIALCKPYTPGFYCINPDFPDVSVCVRAMEDYYAYTDRLHEEQAGKTEGFTLWDFSAFRPDAIVVNLGTNDAFYIKAIRDSREEVNFQAQYKQFLYTLRRLNGNKPVIGCTLGPMDYYLYDMIVCAVEEYKVETGDERVFSYKFGGIFPWGEGFGAGDHPSVATHKRMGTELAQKLAEWLELEQK